MDSSICLWYSLAGKRERRKAPHPISVDGYCMEVKYGVDTSILIDTATRPSGLASKPKHFIIDNLSYYQRRK